MLFNVLKNTESQAVIGYNHIESLKKYAAMAGLTIKVSEYTYWYSVDMNGNGLLSYISYNHFTDQSHSLHIYLEHNHELCLNIPLKDLEVIYIL